jgi:hypothetical protein
MMTKIAWAAVVLAIFAAAIIGDWLDRAVIIVRS